MNLISLVEERIRYLASWRAVADMRQQQVAQVMDIQTKLVVVVVVIVAQRSAHTRDPALSEAACVA